MDNQENRDRCTLGKWVVQGCGGPAACRFCGWGSRERERRRRLIREGKFREMRNGTKALDIRRHTEEDW